MPTYLVHGTEGEERVSKMIEAGTAAEAEAIARKLGVEVIGSEIAPAAAAAGQANPPEEAVWSGHPSLWVNFWWYASCLLVLPIPFAIYHHFKIKCTRYTLTTQRLKVEAGVIAKNVEETELYRVVDTAAGQSALERVLGIGTVTVVTNDERNPQILLHWVPDPRGLREKIRQLGESRRRWRRVAEVEVM